MEHYDTIFTELPADAGGRTRLVAAMALQKPATMWVSHLPSDATFVFGLLHGVFPMAPAPAGDHSLGMSGMYTYLKYGPMMRALQGRVWNLQPHAISAYIGNTTTPAAGSAQGGPGVGVDANLFDLPDGSSVAVLALRGTTTATVILRLARVAAEPAVKVESLQLGRTENWAPAAARDGTVQLEIRSTVAMLRIS